MARARAAATFCLLGSAAGQQASVVIPEEHPSLTLYACAANLACAPERGGLTLDAQYRWVHAADSDSNKNCINEGAWDKELCPDAKTCAANCAVEGLSRDSYTNTYGISLVSNGFKLEYRHEGGGSRVHFTEGEASYKVLQLKNREITFDVDVSLLPCGVQSVVTLTPMDPEGEKGIGKNAAGAAHGLGRCDATCTRSVKFPRGEANLKHWDAESGTGALGMCCPELRLWEANKESVAMSMHACANTEPEKCEGAECTRKCDSMGCQFDPHTLGNPHFFGPDAQVSSKDPVTVVTQFITDDGTDSGKLSEVRRFYTQRGKTIENARANEQRFPTLLSSNSVTDEFCSALKELQSTSAGPDYMGRLSKALENGLVLTASIEEAEHTSGPCKGADARSAHNASVVFSNFMYGEITSTCPDCIDEVLSEEVQEQNLEKAAAVKAAPKPFVQTAAFKYVLYGAGALTLCLLCSTFRSSQAKPGWTVSGGARGRR